MLTEKDAAMSYIKTWSSFDCTDFLNLLADDACYESQWVFDKLEGKEAIAEYLIGKLKTVKASDNKVRAELGMAKSGKDCVYMYQGKGKHVKAVVFFDVVDNQIKRYDLCIPQIYL